MATKISRASLMGLLGGFLIVLSITGCGTILYNVMPVKTKNFTITGVEYDEAFSKAIRAAMETGFRLSYGASPDKSSGTFSVSRGSGFVETTEMNFFLEKGTQGKLSFMVRVKSGSIKGSEGVIDEFLAAYGKYVKISP